MPVPKLPLHLTGLLFPYHLWWWRRTLRHRSVLTAWNHRHKAIFVHIPKTAGTSLLASLGADPVFDTHAPARAYRDVYADFYGQALTFTFVRNPWDRLASSFHFLKYGTDWPMQQMWARRHIGELDFAGFVRRLEDPLYRARVMSERFFWPQTFWLGGIGDARGVDEIYRFEQLAEAIPELCARLGIDPPQTPPHLRKVDKQDFRALYDARSVEIVRRLYAPDIKALGYEFPG